MHKKEGYCIFQTMYASPLTAKYLAQQMYFLQDTGDSHHKDVHRGNAINVGRKNKHLLHRHSVL